MTKRSSTYLKGISETGDVANQTLFEDLIDSMGVVDSGTTFDDSGAITVDSTVEYSTIRTVTGSTHTLTAATSGNVAGNYKKVRYTFDVDCTLTLTDFDETGSTLGTINPIAANTYDFWFFTTPFGLALVIQNNASGTVTPTQLLAVTIDTVTAGNTEIDLDFTNPNGGDEDSNLIQYKLATEPTVWTDGVSLASGAITGTQTGLTNGLEYDLRIVAKGSGSFSDADPSNEVSATPNNYSATANAIFARLTTLTTTEKDAINTFVNSQASAEGGNGNYELLDEVYFFGLTNEADALKGWKSAILTKSGSPTKSADGYTFAGTERLITSGLTFSNYTLNNAIVGFDLASVNANLNERVVQGSDGFLDIHSGTASTRVNCALNSSTASITGFGDFFPAKFHFARYSSSNFYAYYNTTQAQDRAQASSTISSNVLSIGNTDAGSSPYTSIIRGLWIGAQSGFDISAWVTAYNTMLTSLGL